MPALVKKLLAIVAAVLVVGIGLEFVRAALQSGRVRPFTATELNGQPFSIESAYGKGPILLCFFATWCSPCRMEIPEILRLDEQYRPDGLQVIYLTQEDAATIKADAQNSALPFRMLVNATDAFEKHRVESLPRTMLVSPTGDIQLELSGVSESGLRQLREKVSELIPTEGSARRSD